MCPLDSHVHTDVHSEPTNKLCVGYVLNARYSGPVNTDTELRVLRAKLVELSKNVMFYAILVFISLYISHFHIVSVVKVTTKRDVSLD